LAAPPPPPPLPPLPPPPPPPPPAHSKLTEHELKKQLREKEKERSKRGLPSLRDSHLCIASKTLWLGHLSKSTTEEYVTDEIIELLSPSSSNDASDRLKAASRRNKSYQSIIVDVHLIPPRGCAYVEFVDRKMAAKCLDRLKDGYRLDGNYIKVAWATNKGINKDRRIKQHWSVDVGCTFIPFAELETIRVGTSDFVKWAEGGLVDEDSIPERCLGLYRKLILQNSANTVDSNSSKSLEGVGGVEKTSEQHAWVIFFFSLELEKIFVEI
jgi:RNA recognition motif-containing protein